MITSNYLIKPNFEAYLFNTYQELDKNKQTFPGGDYKSKTRANNFGVDLWNSTTGNTDYSTFINSPSAQGGGSLFIGSNITEGEVNYSTIINGNVIGGAGNSYFNIVLGGRLTGANEPKNTAIGYNATISGNESTTLGNYSIGSNRSTSLGAFAESVNDSISIGYRSQTIGTYSIALGRSAIVSGSHSSSINCSTEVTANYTHIIGDNGDKVGIGTVSPTANLQVNGTFKLVDGAQASGKVLTSDSTGLAT
jgi:hypothetical protein